MELLALWAHMPRLEARRMRQRCQAAGTRLSVDAVYSLTLAETENESLAQRAASDYAAELMRRGETPS